MRFMVSGGTALEINNGTIKVSGTVRAAFRWASLRRRASGGVCSIVSHPLLNGDPDALVLVTPACLATPGSPS